MGECRGMDGDLRIFFGRKYAHRTARSCIADATLRRLISFRVEAYAKPREAIADAGSHLCVVFSDAAGKDQQSGPIECGNHACHMFANRVTSLPPSPITAISVSGTANSFAISDNAAPLLASG